MKYALLTTLLLLTHAALSAQALLSPETGRLMLRHAAAVHAADYRGYVVRPGADGRPTTGALLEINGPVDEAALNDLGVEVQGRYGDLMSVRLPLTALQPLRNVPGVRYIEVDVRLEPALDSARADARINDAYDGTGLDLPARGGGALVGVIDGGFDFTHPAFRRQGSKEHRIRTVWLQDATGNPPSPFTYGTEIRDAAAITARQFDAKDESHGSHVACIAAGVGPNGDAHYRGVAPEAELALVSTLFTQTSILDGVRYLISESQKASKPLAVNISIAGRTGPHDGTSSFDRAMETLVKPGQIVVGATGNWGGKPSHIYADFAAGPGAIQTIPHCDKDSRELLVDMWGETKKDFEATLSVIDTTGRELWRTPVAFSTKKLQNYKEDTVNVDGAQVIVGAGTYPVNSFVNNKGRIQIYAYSSKYPAQFFRLEISGKTGGVHAWHANNYFYDTIPQLAPVPGCVRGSFDYTTTEVGGTGKRILTAGAHTTHNAYTTIDGQPGEVYQFAPLGALAPFSGKGPTADGRVKPDLTASGNIVLSAQSSFDNTISAALQSYAYTEGDKTWKYFSQHGTSMSAPMVTGTVALLLELNPWLTFDQVRDVLINSARQDAFTGAIGAEGSNLWGHGKLNTFAALRKLYDMGLVSVDPTPTVVPFLSVYPNPVSDGRVQVWLRDPAPAEFAILDVTGRTMWRGGAPGAVLDIGNLTAGVYVLEAKQGARKAVTRLLVR